MQRTKSIFLDWSFKKSRINEVITGSRRNSVLGSPAWQPLFTSFLWWCMTHHDCGNLPDLILFERNSNFYPYHRKHQDNLIVFVEISKVFVRKQNPCINLNWKFLFSHIRHHGEHYKQKHVITSIFDLLQIKVRLLLHRSWTS